MRPADSSEFFRLPSPPGRSRESTLRLDAEGRFWHDGARVENVAMIAALHTWIGRHPDDGRYVLSNGYDWTYFAVDDAPYQVRSLRLEPDRVTLVLSDGTEETWEPESTRVGADGALYATVKRQARAGPFEAKFSRHAQASLEPVLVEASGRPAAKIGGNVHAIGAKEGGFG